jgi:hypothetical protein
MILPANAGTLPCDSEKKVPNFASLARIRVQTRVASLTTLNLALIGKKVANPLLQEVRTVEIHTWIL